MQVVSRLAIARDGAFGVDKIFVDRGKARRCAYRLNVGILAIKIRDIFESLVPCRFIDLERSDGIQSIHDGFFGKIVDRVRVCAEALHLRLFVREGLTSGFVGLVGGEPDLVPKRDRIIIERQNIGFAHPLAVVAVLFVVANADHHSEYAESYALTLVESAEGRLSIVVVDVVDAVLDVIRGLDLLNL